MKFEKEEKDSKNERFIDEGDFHICPECEGSGQVIYDYSKGKELCMMCDGLGIVYED